jgi:predicted RNase H-like nuclease
MVEREAGKAHAGGPVVGELGGKIVGVDGCRAGWLAVSRTPLTAKVKLHGAEQPSIRSPGFDTSVAVYATIDDLWQDHQDATGILIDMPIGLPDARARLVEPAARGQLPGKASSVFSVPCRQAVFASSYVQACDINEVVLGKRLSLQAWYICPKICELDGLLQSSKQAASVIREAHPELAFARLRGAPLQYSKKLAAGHNERLEILARYQPDLADLYVMSLRQWRRRQVQADDILDAMALLTTLNGDHQTLLALSSVDATGLEMNLIMPARYSSLG